MKRITRTRRLTPVEAAEQRTIRELVSAEFPKLDVSQKDTAIFLNGVEQNKEFHSFKIPTADERGGRKVGDYVKVCADSERFWVRITAVEPGFYTGVIDQDLVHSRKHGLNDGDVIRLVPDNIIGLLINAPAPKGYEQNPPVSGNMSRKCEHVNQAYTYIG